MKTPLFLDPGLFRDRAVLERAEEVPDGMGGARIEWIAVREISVHIEAPRVRRDERFDQSVVELECHILCRRGDDVERGRRLRIGERQFAIEAVFDPDGRGRYLACLCRESV